MSYEEITLKDPNPIKRFLQNSRFEDAINFIPKNILPEKILDFGGGNGELSLRLTKKYLDTQITCYEPSESMINEAKNKISGASNVTLTDSIEPFTNQNFDVIFSLEVFEHLPEKESLDALNTIKKSLHHNGILIIGVPNEIFLAACYKGLFRMLRRYGDHDAKPMNILKSCFGFPPKYRPTQLLDSTINYHSHHLGFDYRTLHHTLCKNFNSVQLCLSPSPWLTRIASPEIYFVASAPKLGITT